MQLGVCSKARAWFSEFLGLEAFSNGALQIMARRRELNPGVSEDSPLSGHKFRLLLGFRQSCGSGQ